MMSSLGQDCRGSESLVQRNLTWPGLVSASSMTVMRPGSRSPEEADEDLERAELPVHGVLLAVGLHHGELVVEGTGGVMLPHGHHQRPG